LDANGIPGVCSGALQFATKGFSVVSRESFKKLADSSTTEISLYPYGYG
jgi:hypothetical protein